MGERFVWPVLLTAWGSGIGVGLGLAGRSVPAITLTALAVLVAGGLYVAARR